MYERLTFNQPLLSSPIIYFPDLNRFTVYLSHPLHQYCPHFSFQHPNKVRLQIFQQPIILHLIFPTSLYSSVLVAWPSSKLPPLLSLIFMLTVPTFYYSTYSLIDGCFLAIEVSSVKFPSTIVAGWALGQYDSSKTLKLKSWGRGREVAFSRPESGCFLTCHLCNGGQVEG